MTDDPSSETPERQSDPLPERSPNVSGDVRSDPESGSDDPSDSGEGSDRDGSLGISIAVYAFRLTVAALVVGGRFLHVGFLLARRHLGDAKSRSEGRRWLLLEGDRRVIVVGFVGGVFGIALLLGMTDVIGVRESRFVTTMFSTMIAGLFSFIPIVVAVNQLIISRLFGTPERLSSRIDGVQEFRARVESQTEGDGVSPTDPAPFLARLAGTLGSRADALATECERPGRDEPPVDGCLGAAGPSGEESLSALESIRQFAARTREHTDTLSSRLTGETTSVFAVVLPTIDHDYAGAANEARRLGERFDEELSERAATLLSELRELFVTADATRQYFTTIYLQRELARLSRLITYSGTAALLLSTLVIMIYASGYPPVANEGPLLVLVSLALAVAFSPLGVLFAYVVRISAILKRSSAPGAFTPPGEYHRATAAETAPDGLEDESTAAVDSTDDGG